MTDESRRPRPDEEPGSYVASDASIQLPFERTHASPGETYEEIRDNEQLGRPRSQMLHQVQHLAPPAAGGHIQSDQIGRQTVEEIIAGDLDPKTATPDAANTEGSEYP